ncbi:hypothetical protein [Burkholderia pseudomallei]|uniref:hypothetical protein n=1 Tax=Burkholderia pseudomallei TaxID=28450 RepID=UPI0004856C6E|nr:hypothetical protein [Burkholderia pseudomallei]
MEDTFDRVKTMLGHKSPLSTLAYYAGVTSHDKDAASAKKHALMARAFFLQMTTGMRLAESLREASAVHEAPCITASMVRYEPSTWDFSEYMEATRSQMPAADGLLRRWSDLDRTGTLAAHLAALDGTLDS